MQVGILGPLIVADGARPIEVGGARLRALLIRLACSAGGWVSVGELVEALWESAPPSDEVNALQSLISRLRRALPTSSLIESGPGGYRLAIDPEAVDAIRFERLATQGRRRLRDGHPEEASTQLGAALELWRGTALTEVADRPYAMAWGQRLEKLRLTAIDNWATAGLQLGRHPEVIAELEDVVEAHPLRERSHELLIRALAGNGRQTEALAVYERLSRRLAGELGLDPPLHLQHLQTAVIRNDPKLLAVEPTALPPVFAAPPKPPPPRQRRTNLRSPLTTFVGRSSEIAQIAGQLDLGSRLITLVGTGGAGKTRLASETATAVKSIGPDGVWMVELAPVTDPEDVASTVLGSIGSLDLRILERSPTAHRDAPSRLIDTLAEQNVVLILDNCEHVLDAAAKIAEYLLGHCPNLKIIATSREPLGIVGESLCMVPPLSIPEPGVTGEAALNSPAVRLFLDRAALVRPNWAATPANTVAVQDICRRLDGLPLAIELAAARLRNLPVEAIAARLGNRFQLLTGGNRTAMPRHQTLRAVVAWSWELLTESERILAERISVFPGGADAEAAETVCGHNAPDAGAALPADAVADLLMSLADKSLLVVVEPSRRDGPAQPRYRMLETIREYALEQLAERGESLALRTAHAQYFLQFAEAVEPKIRTAEQLIWVDRVTVERDNLLAALRFAVEVSDADTAIRLVAALTWYWTLLGRHDEAASWIEQALKVPGERPSDAYAIAFMVHLISTAAAGLGVPEEEEVRHLLRTVSEIDLEMRHPILALVEPGVALIQDRGEEATLAIERNLAHPDPWARAMLHLMSAVRAENDGDVEQLYRSLPVALSAFREIGDGWGIATATSLMASLHSAEGRVEDAIASLQEARELLTRVQAVDDGAYALVRIGMLRLRQGDLESARRDIESAVALVEENTSMMSHGFAKLCLAMLEHHEGRTDLARRLGHKALAAVDRSPITPAQVRASIHSGLAMFEISDGDFELARKNLAQAHQGIMASMDMPVAGQVATVVADFVLASGDPAAAAELLGAGIRLRGMEDLSDLDIQRVASAARAALGPEGYARHLEKGRNLTKEAALALLETSIAVP